jgi:Cd2+/Zn2+-exporting ATPase
VLDIHMLMVIAVAGAIALGEFTEAATVVVLFSLSDFLEGRCSGQVRVMRGRRGWGLRCQASV